MSDSKPSAPAPTVDTSAIRQIASGVWVIPDHRVPLVPNIGIVVGDHSALVIDTGTGIKNGRAVLEAARRLAGDRKLILTLTHFHPEHGYGAQPFKGVAKIVYNRSQALELADKGQSYLEMFKGMGPAIAEALEGTELVAADELYDGPLHEIDLGGRVVQLRNWGKAHTRGDQIVFLPAERILFTGDLAEEKTFPIFPWFPPHDADIDGANWLRALEDCIAMKPEIVVPGHGELGGVDIIIGVRDYIAAMAQSVRDELKRVSEEELVAQLAPRIRAQYPDWHFPEWIDFAIRYHASLV
ncbi:MBL fold metallo-hydrolase [Brucella tritici]|uniref:MBL fold metallo-hydrolase n=1 Tax=Brucella tritici TaxID=94626 RepID=UPI00159166BC|nr:MBL fold metallo-hydrolase [Brucella tritici]